RHAAERWWHGARAPLPTLQFSIRRHDQFRSRRAREAEVPNPEGAEGSSRHLATCIAQEPDSVASSIEEVSRNRKQRYLAGLQRTNHKPAVTNDDFAWHVDFIAAVGAGKFLQLCGGRLIGH